MAKAPPKKIIDQTPEPWRVNILTPAEKLRQESMRAAYYAFVTACYAAVLLPFLFFSSLLLDLPLRWFDPLTGGRNDLATSNWLSIGEAIMALTIPLLVLMTRRRGEGLVGHVHLLAWFVGAILVAILLYSILPELTADDFPSNRFLIGYFGGWFIGQSFAIQLYDVTRGGNWWRAPLYACLIGFACQSLIYFPVAYWGQPVPWLAWGVFSMILKAGLAIAFLELYALLRHSLRPWLGLGG